MKDDIKKLLERDRFAKAIGIELMDMKPGYAAAKMSISEMHLNGVDIVQGGAIFTLADFTFAAAANAHGIITVAINGNMSFLRACKGKLLMAEAKEVSSTKKIVNYHVDIYDEEKTLVAQLYATGYKLKPLDTTEDR